MRTEQRPVPPHPGQVRRPNGAFGWLDAQLLHERWLQRLGPSATAVLLFLALAADRQGASFYGRGKMAGLLGLDRSELDLALKRLLELELVALRPWREGHPDGVWQLLALPQKSEARSGSPAPIAELLKSLGLARNTKD